MTATLQIHTHGLLLPGVPPILDNSATLGDNDVWKRDGDDADTKSISWEDKLRSGKPRIKDLVKHFEEHNMEVQGHLLLEQAAAGVARTDDVLRYVEEQAGKLEDKDETGEDEMPTPSP